jgi:ABC-2 type transport system permease protein
MVILPFGWIELMQTIRSGEVVTDLSKPCDFFLYWCSREIGHAFYYLFWRCLPTYLAGLLIFGLLPGPDWQTWPIFLSYLVLGAMTGVVYRVLLNLIAFWIIEARSIIVLGLTVAQFFSGAYIPVVFFPTWLLLLSHWLPFNGLMNVPTQIFLGKLSGQALFWQLLLQFGWLLLLIVLVRAITAMATRRVVVQGG